MTRPLAAASSTSLISMAPLASQVLRPLPRGDSTPADVIVFKGEWNEVWTAWYPSLLGGYPVCLLVQAAQMWIAQMDRSKAKSETVDLSQLDPMNVTTTFLIATTAKLPFRIEVKGLKRGGMVTFLEARFLQPSNKANDYVPYITSSFMMTNFPSRSTPQAKIQGPTLSPSPSMPSFYACPLSDPRVIMSEQPAHWAGQRASLNFTTQVRIFHDVGFNDAWKQRKGSGTEFGAWLEFTEDALEGSQEVSHTADWNGQTGLAGYHWLPIAVDVYWNTAQVLGLHKGQRVWYPTMSLTIEYKRRIPGGILGKGGMLKRWGHISRGKFLDNGQFENDTEIWSHPEDNPQLDPPMKAEDGPQILAIGRQVGLTIELEKRTDPRLDQQKKRQQQGKL